MSPLCPSTLQEQQHHSVSNVQIPKLPASGFVSDLLSLPRSFTFNPIGRQTLAVQPTATNATSHLVRALASAEFSVQKQVDAIHVVHEVHHGVHHGVREVNRSVELDMWSHHARISTSLPVRQHLQLQPFP